MTANVNGVELDDLLFDLRPFPLSRIDWELFLKEEHADENLAFWIETQTYRQIVLKENSIVRGQVVELKINVELAKYESPVAYAKEIIDKWIGPTATVAELNISDKMRQDILLKVNSGGEDPVDFEPIQAEVKKMMTSGERFARFVKRQMSRNITDSEARCRLITGIILVSIFTILGVLLRVLAGDRLQRYGLALAICGPLQLGFHYLLSSQSKICSGRSIQGSKMRNGTDWFEARRCSDGCNFNIVLGEACEMKVKDKAAANAIRRRGILQLFFMAILGIGLSVGIAALPPY